MSISTSDIKLLRDATGVGILDCKKALEASNGDVDQAIDLLRKKGLASAAKKTSREANEGLVSAQVNDNGQADVMVEVNCETDFVARTDDFQNFVGSLVRQLSQQPGLNNPEALLAAPFIDNGGQTVQDQLTKTIAKLGENIVVRHVARFESPGDSLIDSYIHIGGRVGVLVEMAGDTGQAQFVELLHDLALQIAAAAPRYIDQDEVPEPVVEAEKSIYRSQMAEEDKPDHIKERIIEGKLKKWYTEVVLLNQEFVKDTNLTVAQLLARHSKALGSPLEIRRFARFELGAA